MARSTRTSAKYLGRTQRIQTPHDLLQKIKAQMLGTHSSVVQIERNLAPQEAIARENETKFYGS